MTYLERIRNLFRRRTNKRSFYSGAGTHRLLSNFIQTSKSADTEIKQSLRVLRNRIKNFDTPDDINSYVKTSVQSAFTYKDIKSMNTTFWNNEIFNLGVKKVRKKISDISDLANNNNSEFYLVIYPWAETLVHGQKLFNWENFAKEICINDKCNLVNTFPEFRDKKNICLLYAAFARKNSRANTFTILEKKDFYSMRISGSKQNEMVLLILDTKKSDQKI